MGLTYELLLHYLTQGRIPLIITSFQKLNRQKCRKDSNIWFWYPVLSQTLPIKLLCNVDNNKSSWYVLNRTTVIYIFTCVRYKKYKNKKQWKKQKGKGKGVFTIHFRLKTFLNKEKEEGEEQTIFLFHRDHLSEAPIKYPAKNIWGDL